MLVNPVFGGAGQPVNTIEAMAAGLPPVILERLASAVSVIHGVKGFIAGTDTEFARYGTQPWKDPNLCQTMGAAAIDTLRECCAREAFDRWLERARGA